MIEASRQKDNRMPLRSLFGLFSIPKMIWISSRVHDSSPLFYNSPNGSHIEESTTAYLFASCSKFVARKVSPLAHIAAEFADLLEPSSGAELQVGK
jgi:hypothetical protein